MKKNYELSVKVAGDHWMIFYTNILIYVDRGVLSAKEYRSRANRHHFRNRHVYLNG